MNIKSETELKVRLVDIVKDKAEPVKETSRLSFREVLIHEMAKRKEKNMRD